jgi:hypothetical protein
LIPLCVAATLSLLDVLRHIPSTHSLVSPELVWLLTGFLLWLAMWILLPPPVKAYVIGHELTHALWAWLFGGRAHDLRFSERGGSVRLTKSNVWITLAPYFFPLYTIIVILLRFVTGLFVDEVPFPFAWLFFVGLTWGFHVTFTIQSLMITQPDIQEYGRLFSYAVIYLINLAGVGIWVVCTTAATLTDFATSLIVHSISVYASVSDEISTRSQFLGDLAKSLFNKILYYRG